MEENSNVPILSIPMMGNSVWEETPRYYYKVLVPVLVKSTAAIRKAFYALVWQLNHKHYLCHCGRFMSSKGDLLNDLMKAVITFGEIDRDLMAGDCLPRCLLRASAKNPLF